MPRVCGPIFCKKQEIFHKLSQYCTLLNDNIMFKGALIVSVQHVQNVIHKYALTETQKDRKISALANAFLYEQMEIFE